MGVLGVEGVFFLQIAFEELQVLLDFADSLGLAISLRALGAILDGLAHEFEGFEPILGRNELMAAGFPLQHLF